MLLWKAMPKPLDTQTWSCVLRCCAGFRSRATSFDRSVPSILQAGRARSESLTEAAVASDLAVFNSMRSSGSPELDAEVCRKIPVELEEGQQGEVD